MTNRFVIAAALLAIASRGAGAPADGRLTLERLYSSDEFEAENQIKVERDVGGICGEHDQKGLPGALQSEQPADCSVGTERSRRRPNSDVAVVQRDLIDVGTWAQQP